MLITKTIAAATLSLVVNDIPLQASFMKGSAPGCEMSADTARQWRAAGDIVVEQQVGDWCIAGKVADGVWLAEQWSTTFSTDKKSRGWLVRIPLNKAGTRLESPPFRFSQWPLEVFDADLKTRVRYRQSFSQPADHHQKSISNVARGSLVLTRPHPDGGSYSVAIERGAKP